VQLTHPQLPCVRGSERSAVVPPASPAVERKCDLVQAATMAVPATEMQVLHSVPRQIQLDQRLTKWPPSELWALKHGGMKPDVSALSLLSRSLVTVVGSAPLSEDGSRP